MVPLKHIDYSVEIVNGIASVSMVQAYHNPSESHLQLEYSFPVDPRSCIYRFVAEFGANRIEAVVKEKEAAKAEFTEAVAQGRSAGYGEIDSESRDIMNLQIGNVPGHSDLVVTISLLQELSVSLNTFFRLEIPSTISPRYTNVPPSAPTIPSAPVSEAPGDFTWSFKVSLVASRKISFAKSSTHQLSLLSSNDGGTEQLYVMDQACRPNVDFAFYFATEDFHLPSFVLGKNDVNYSAMISFVPRFCSLAADDAYVASLKGETFETDVGGAKAEFLFLLDRSGSMGGKRIERAKEALVLFLKSLPTDSHFNILSFGSHYENMFAKSQPYNEKSIVEAISAIKGFSANLGGTNIDQPLSQLLDSAVISGYPKQIYLLTDGGVSNTEGVIKMVGLKTKFARVHTIGIGNGASAALIKGCAEKGKGRHVFITDDENVADKIIGLLSESLSPVISEVTLDFDSSAIESVVPNPKSIPYVLKDEALNFFATFKPGFQGSSKFRLSYIDSLNKAPYASEAEVSTAESQSYLLVEKMGRFKVLRSMEEAAKGSAESAFWRYAKPADYKKQAIEESVKHQILSEFTAFVCVGKQLNDLQYQEYCSVPSQTIKIANPSPNDYKESVGPGIFYSKKLAPSSAPLKQ